MNNLTKSDLLLTYVLRSPICSKPIEIDLSITIYLYLQVKRVLGICIGAMTIPYGMVYQILCLMNQRPIGVIVKVMDGRIQPFQAQYPMTPKIMIIRIMVLVIVWESEGTHILHTVLYYENV